MRFTFTVEVEVQRDEGKFASRDEIAEQLRDAIESADPGSLEGGEGGQYSTCGWDVDEQPQPKRKRASKPKATQVPAASNPAPRIVIRVPACPEPTLAEVQASVDAMLKPGGGS